MNARLFELVDTFSVGEIDALSQRFREQIFDPCSTTANPHINVYFHACIGDFVAGPLTEPILNASTDNPGKTASPSSLLSPTQMKRATLHQVARAARGSVALNVLEDTFADERTAGRDVTITGFAEMVDLHVSSVIDHHGCRWPITPHTDCFRFSSARFNRVTTVSPLGPHESTTAVTPASSAPSPPPPTHADSEEDFEFDGGALRINAAFEVARALRAVAATTYAVMNGTMGSNSMGNSDNFDEDSDPGSDIDPVTLSPSWTLAIALSRTVAAASRALVSVRLAQPTVGIDGPTMATLHLPCGSDLILRTTFSADASHDILLHGVTFQKAHDTPLSPMALFTFHVLSPVLLGSGLHVHGNFPAFLAGAVENIVTPDENLVHILYSQAYVVTMSLTTTTLSGLARDFSSEELVRFLTLYRIARWIPNCGNDAAKDAFNIDEERVLLAHDEVVDVLEQLEGCDIAMCLGDVDDQDDDQICSEIGSASNVRLQPHSPVSSLSTNGMKTSTISLTSDDGAIDSEDERREAFLHYGSGSSDLSVLDADFVSPDGLSILARRGVTLKPDPRRSVIIRKKKALWGRVTFQNATFVLKPLLSAEMVLRAIIPVQKIGILGVSVTQFEANGGDVECGDEVANLLLSGAFGSGAALWALKKIIYSGRGVKPKVPSYLNCLLGRTDSEGWGIVSLLGSDAVRDLEVVVDDAGRVIMDFEGDLKPMQVMLEGRRLRCVEIDGYVGGRVGTIVNKACIF